MKAAVLTPELLQRMEIGANDAGVPYALGKRHDGGDPDLESTG